MTTKKKSKVSAKRVLKAKYETGTIYYGDGEYLTFNLLERSIYIDYDWVEIVKKDGTGSEIFAVVNVSRMSFGMNTAKDIDQKTNVVPIKGNDSTLKPIA